MSREDRSPKRRPRDVGMSREDRSPKRRPRDVGMPREDRSPNRWPTGQRAIQRIENGTMCHSKYLQR
jgi:hypothetical protein